MGDEDVAGQAGSNAVLHVLVVGFHHKKGCIVEYAYPPLLPDGEGHSSELPSQWRHLPSLALPDGSHNFESDTAFFHLPDLVDPRRTIFGISCYRQIELSRVVNPTEDMTRGTIQKSVCVLSRLPLYGHIQVKMALITEAFFREANFSRLDLIHQTFDNLSACLTDDLVATQQLYVGLSARKLVEALAHRTLMLFKLFLLEKRVLFFQSPVLDLCTFLLTLLSLHPGMLENGLNESACTVPPDTPSPSGDAEDPNCDPVAKDEAEGEKTRGDGGSCVLPTLSAVADISDGDVGLPLKVFGRGNLCLPYLSLSYIDTLNQPCIHGYMIGATNVLFKQKRGLADVIVDIEKDKIDIVDADLKKALVLTTEDLRFADTIVKQVWQQNSSSDVFLDGVGWEGGDEWIRAQFRLYLLCLMRTSLLSASEEVSRFNGNFVDMWRETANYKLWAKCVATKRDEDGSGLLYALPGQHPAAGSLSVADMKLHLSNTITNTEGGKKVSQAVASTGRAVVDGFSTAKGVFSSWMTSFKQPQNAKDTQETDDRADEGSKEAAEVE